MQAHIFYPLRKGIGEYLSYDFAGGVDARVYGCAIPRYEEAAAHPLFRVPLAWAHPLAAKKRAPAACAWQASNAVWVRGIDAWPERAHAT